MKDKLLRFYEGTVSIDPQVPSSWINTLLGYTKVFELSSDWRLSFLYHIYNHSLSNLSIYDGRGISDYFTPVSGYRILQGTDYIGFFDLWFPSEPSFFNLIGNPVIAGYYIQEIMRIGGLGEITEIKTHPNKDEILTKSVESLKNAILSQEFWGFWKGDLRRGSGKRGICVRRFEVKEIIKFNVYHPISIMGITLKDKDSGKTLEMSDYNRYGWNLYLSKSILLQKLSDLEVLWMRGYDNRVAYLDHQIKEKKKELERLIDERKKFMNGIDEYRENIKKKLYGKIA